MDGLGDFAFIRVGRICAENVCVTGVVCNICNKHYLLYRMNLRNIEGTGRSDGIALFSINIVRCLVGETFYSLAVVLIYFARKKGEHLQ